MVHSCVQMAPNTRLGSRVLLHVLLWSLLVAVSICSQDDIDCLRSIKNSLEDPHDRFKSSWNFGNHTEGFICRFVGVECWNASENRVVNIRLSNMRLKGHFPLGISKCTSVTGLDLSNNELLGPIPSNISLIFKYGTSLDLSFNRFSGNIPPAISNCTFLNILKLDHNQLTGLIPPEIANNKRLKIFNVAYNQLHGPVPNFSSDSYLYEISYVGNLGLCGFPSEPCIKRPSFRDSFVIAFVIGYAVSIVSVISTIMYYYYPWMHRNERNKLLREFIFTSMLRRKRNKTEHSHQTSQMLPVDLLHEASRETSVLGELVSRMSYLDLREATNGFIADNIIGFGQMGTTYKATMSNGSILAVKRLFNTQKFDEHFTTELKTLGRLRHDNLVPLLGFCIESNEKLLVYKYMSNGNLYDWLHPAEGSAGKIMEWPLRVKIACGIARGLVWLHQNYNFRIVHLDISSKCILLDQNFEPKISNFGEAILMKSNNTDWNISFCMDSKYRELSFAEEDVYGFGIVLLELVTGKDPSKLTNSSNTGDQTLGKWVNIDISTSSNFYNVIDKSLFGRGCDLEIFQVFRVACNCVQPNPDRRPTMLEVHKSISAVAKNYSQICYNN